MKSNKTEFIYFNKDGTIFSLNGKPLKLLDQFVCLGSNIPSTENDINVHIGKAINSLSTIRKSDLFDKIKRDVFQAHPMSVRQYTCPRQTRGWMFPLPIRRLFCWCAMFRMTRLIRYLHTLCFLIQTANQSLIGVADRCVDGWDSTIKKAKKSKSTPTNREQNTTWKSKNKKISLKWYSIHQSQKREIFGQRPSSQ